MNALLIHNDNLPSPLVDGFDHVIKFDIPQSKMIEYGFSFDKEAHSQLTSFLSDAQYDVIFIPFSLSRSNYLDFTGLRLGLHIRLTRSASHHNTPIVFIGLESKEEVAKLSDYGSFLFTTGIFTTDKFCYEDLSKQYIWICESWKPQAQKPKLTSIEYRNFLNRVRIDPPSNYLSHHSVENEVALMRWSEALKCEHKLVEIKQNLSSGLYFKYILATNPTTEKITGKNYTFLTKAKVLLIDDEAEKGWGALYESLFQFSPSITFDFFKPNSGSFSSQANVIKEAIEEINSYKPDVVLLDLRLCDVDFSENTKPDHFTGVQVLNKIKDINAGIQVVVTTASNKVDTYIASVSAETNGFVVKDGSGDPTAKITHLRESISKALERSRYLKPAYDLCERAVSEIESAAKEDDSIDEFAREFRVLVDISFIMYQRANQGTDFSYAYLALFKSLELILRTFVYEDEGKWYSKYGEAIKNYKWDDSAKQYYVTNEPFYKDKPSNFQKAAALGFDKWGFERNQIRQLYYLIKGRNDFIHPEVTVSKESYKIDTPQSYTKLLKCIHDITIAIHKCC